MEQLLTIPLWIRLAALFVAGAGAGAWANWAIYRWAWRPRAISPWSPPPEGLGPRQWTDQVPVLGWLGLRREARTWGAAFWVRPLLVELGLAVGIALLYWWEVDQLGLVAGQELWTARPALLPVGQLVAGLAAPSWVLHATFLSHAALVVLMTVATMIDADDRIIPDEVTVPGTLLGLMLAALVPLALLPHVSERAMAPAVSAPLADAAGGQAIGPHGLPLWVEPVTPLTPNDWPRELDGFPQASSLAIGLGCYSLWCFALAPRVWRGRRGWQTALGLVVARVLRELGRPPLGVLAVGGTLVIGAAWWWGGSLWMGMLSALVSLAAAGLFVWGVRIVCTGALGVEALGFGDVILVMMIATFVGWQASLVLFFLAPLAGLVIGIARLVMGLGNMLPYGPFLCLAAVVTIVAWAPVWSYIQLFTSVPLLVAAVLIVCLALMWAMLTLWRLVKKLLLGSEGSH